MTLLEHGISALHDSAQGGNRTTSCGLPELAQVLFAELLRDRQRLGNLALGHEDELIEIGLRIGRNGDREIPFLERLRQGIGKMQRA